LSEFAFFRFKSNNMLSVEEVQQKEEIINLTEEVLEAKGIECDSRIAKLSEEKLREILEEVRKLRRKRKRLSLEKTGNITREAYTDKEQGQQQEENEMSYIR